MTTTVSVLLLAAFAIVAHYSVNLISQLRSPNKSIPGPIWARFSKLWYLLEVGRGDFHTTNIELHRQKGSIVRVAPNYYSFGDPECLKTIYGHGTKYIKSPWYDVWNFKDDLYLTNLFSERDPKRHGANRRKVANMYSMTAMTAYEPFVDDCINLLRKRLDEASSVLPKIDLAHWSQCYAFDVIGEITFGERFGFLERLEDVNGIIATLDGALAVSSCLGLYMWLRPLMLFFLRILGFLANDAVSDFAVKHINAAQMEKSRPDSQGLEVSSPMVKKLTDAKHAQPDIYTDWDIMANVVSNIAAGSDTTAISLSAIFFFIYTNPGVLRKLREEVEGASCSDVPSFKEAQKLPYFQAVVKEALRMHPGVGLPMFREVPEGGAVILGQFFPAQTNVGINSWGLHRDKQVFGADADVFRPERWLEAREAEKTLMERSFIPFGMGSRTCIGKNISLLEINKVVPLFVRDYDVDILGPVEKLEVCNHWFVKPVKFMVQIHKRAK